MEKFLNWGNDFSDIRDDDCAREDFRDKAKNYFADKKDSYSGKFEDLVQRGREVLDDEDMKDTLKVILAVIIFIILLCIIISMFRRKR